LTELVDAFQLHNTVRIVITMAVESHNGKQDLKVTGEAWDKDQGSADPAPSDYTLATLWGSDYVRLMGLLTRLLYVLDFKLGEREWLGIGKHKA